MKVQAILLAALLVLISVGAHAGDISGELHTPWGAPQPDIYHSCNIFGTNSSSGSGSFSASTEPSGIFYHPNLPAGIYSVGFSAKDHWPALYMKNKNVPASGNTWDVLTYQQPYFCKGTEWYYEWKTWYAQSFRATGDNLTGLGLRVAGPIDQYVWVTVHNGDNPWAPQIGPARMLRTKSTQGQCAYWSAGEIATVPGQIYTAKFYMPNNGTFSPWRNTVREFGTTANPDGRAWADGQLTGDQLEMSIHFDDAGMIPTMLCPLQDGATEVVPSGGFVGQTFTAKGSSVLMVTWLCGNDAGSSKLYAVSVHNGVSGGVVGSQIGPTKYVNAVYWNGLSVVSFSPNEVPTTLGNVYFVKLKPMATGTSPQVYKSASYSNYPGGTGYRSTGTNTVVAVDRDFTLGIYEEKWNGALDQGKVGLTSLNITNITDTSAKVVWNLDKIADGLVQYGEFTPYSSSKASTATSFSHNVTLTGLKPNTLYHVRVVSKAANYKDCYSKDYMFVTAPSGVNLLQDPGFESGALSAWTGFGAGRIAPTAWFYGAGAKTGSYGMGGAANGGAINGGAYQRIHAKVGQIFRLNAWQYSYTEGGNFFTRAYQTIMRIGIDPFGGTDPNSLNVKWTAWNNSQQQWSPVTVSAVAASDYVTVFLYGVNENPFLWSVWSYDDVVLTTESQPLAVTAENAVANTADGTWVRVSGLVCTATAAQLNAYYVEKANRTCGLRVETTDTINIGEQVTLVGTMMTKATGERYLSQAKVESKSVATPIKPVHMQLASIGGKSLGSQCTAVPGTVGPYNVNTLVKCSGEVTSIITGHIYINDGSLPGLGLKVRSNKFAGMPTVGRFVSVTGIVQLQGTEGAATVRLMPRESADLSVY